MRCSLCGKDIPEGSKYCPACGMPVSMGDDDSCNDDASRGSWPHPAPFFPSEGVGEEGRAGEATDEGHPTTVIALKPAAKGLQPAPGYEAYRKPIIVAVVTSLVFIALGVAYLIWQTNAQIDAEKAAELSAASAAGVEAKTDDASSSAYALTYSTPVSIAFSITAPNYDASKDSKFVIHIKGLNYKGNKVEEDVYVSSDGKGVSLDKGSYTASVRVSPLLHGGALYDVPADSISFRVNDGGIADGTVLSFEYTVADPSTVTSDEIDQAYYAAVASGMPKESAAALKAAIAARQSN